MTYDHSPLVSELNTCITHTSNWTPQIILFVSQLISGIGQNMHGSLGIAYMDDNVEMNKVPTVLSIIKYPIIYNLQQAGSI